MKYWKRGNPAVDVFTKTGSTYHIDRQGLAFQVGPPLSFKGRVLQVLVGQPLTVMVGTNKESLSTSPVLSIEEA